MTTIMTTQEIKARSALVSLTQEARDPEITGKRRRKLLKAARRAAKSIPEAIMDDGDPSATQTPECQ